MKKHGNAIRIAAMMVMVLLMAVIAAPGMTAGILSNPEERNETVQGEMMEPGTYEEPPMPEETPKEKKTRPSETSASQGTFPIPTATPAPRVSAPAPAPAPEPQPPRITDNNTIYVFLGQGDNKAVFHVTGIAGEQIIKLMTLGLTEAEAEEQIINGFLK